MTDTLSWTERYRPETLDGIVGHDTAVETLKGLVDDPEMPNLLLAGPEGVGKTAAVHGLAREKYGEAWKNEILELNASDDRGIDVVREDIKEFARQGSLSGEFGVVFLDEADNLTSDAQPALRRIMEDYDDLTRFVLSCNYRNQLIDPIQSRVAPLRFTRLAPEEVEIVLSRVIEGEDLDVDDAAKTRIVRLAGGDARKAINTLQVATGRDGRLTAEKAVELVSLPERSVVERVVDDAIAGDYEDAFALLDDELLSEAVPATAIVEEVQSVVANHRDLDAYARMRADDAVGEADWRVRNGANPRIQLKRMLAAICLARHHSPEGFE